MSQTSFHTKYRPDSFDSIVGHASTIKSLRQTVSGKRTKVFLFTGPAGTGKTTLARILANEVCGGEATSGNIIEVPAAKYTGVEAMREITDKAVSRALGASPNKVFILDEAHRLSGQAWDSLLKAIEEPPAHVYYMLCTTNPSKVPATIQTRCYRVELSPLSEDEITKVIKRATKGEKVKISDSIIEVIAEASRGSARQALVNLEQCLYCESASEARKLLREPGQTKEVIDFCRFLMMKSGRDWKGAVNILKDLKDVEAESIRIVVSNYMASVAMGSKSDKEAMRVLEIMDCFSTPYMQSDKFAPLLLSTASAIGLGE